LSNKKIRDESFDYRIAIVMRIKDELNEVIKELHTYPKNKAMQKKKEELERRYKLYKKHLVNIMDILKKDNDAFYSIIQDNKDQINRILKVLNE